MTVPLLLLPNSETSYYSLIKKINIYNKDGTLLICITAIDTQSKIKKSSSVTVADSEGSYWPNALQFPKPNPYLEKPLFEMHKKYMKGSVHNNHLH